MAQENKMDEIKISLDAAGSEGEISIVRVDGVIDTMTASELEKVMNSLLDRSRYNIIIDLGGVDYISSAGWGIFISNIREIRQNNGDLKLARMIPNVYEIYELLEFDSILKAFENVEKAKSDFSILLQPESGHQEPGSRMTSAEVIEEKPMQSETIRETKQAPPQKEPKLISDHAGQDVSEEEKKVLELAVDDPFLSIREMKRVINSEADSGPKLGWWRIRKILKKHDILSKKKRFRFARSK
jgi:anti-sigma B factor antagonist